MSILEKTFHEAKIANYTIVEKIEETRGSIVYRGYKENDEKKYIIKELKASSPTVSEIARFKHEYEIIKKIDIEGVIKTYDILEHDNRLAIVLEDFNAVELLKILKDKKIDVSLFLKIAIDLAGTLGFLHKNNIIHMDIKPKNILFNTTTEIVKITDFGIANEISRENMEIYNQDVISGTLAYMSPEQTGRVNRQLDYRTDMYSLGITFYEILTGSVPFLAQDPMEVIHNHIAGEVKPPTELDPAVPEMLSDIVCKLLAKIPEERYQNCYGLLNDLQECQKRLEATGRIDEFELGKNDISLLFTIPQILVGREKELDTLLKIIELGTSTDKQSDLLLVTGAPGIGKSSLIQEIQEPMVSKRGYFITGKYDQFKRDVPYSAIIKAFDDLIQQVLVEGDKRIEDLRKRILDRITANGKVITDVITDLEHIIGKQPDIPELGPEGNQNRFNYVFENFVSAISSEEHPLVLFLDDLQWADMASLHLINLIITSNMIKNFLIIGSYRDTEVDNSHPLHMMLETVKEKGTVVRTIHLDILNNSQVNEMISRFLRCNQEVSEPLAQIVHEKTHGNPFFINQFIKDLYDKELLTLNPVSGWQWDIDQIQETQITDNVAQLMTRRIATLPDKTRDILTICACIGNRFNLEFVCLVTGTSIQEIYNDIDIAVKEGMLRIRHDFYYFQHDHIQEAIYSLIPQEVKNRLHYQIGHLWYKKTGEENLWEEIINIVDHVNKGKSQAQSKEDNYLCARLNLMAGQKAKASSAYKSAQTYFSAGIDFVQWAGEKDRTNKNSMLSWEEQYELCLALYSEAAMAACPNGDYEKMEEWASIVLKHAKSLPDKKDIYITKMIGLFVQEKLNDALDIALDVLKENGITFPKNPGKLHVILGLLHTQLNLRNKEIRALCELPILKDPIMQTIVHLLAQSGPAAFYRNPNLLMLMIMKSIKLALKYGNNQRSPYFSYAGYGFALCSIGLIDTGYEFGQLALNLIEKIKAKDQIPSTYFVVHHFITHWKKHLNTTLEPTRYAHQCALDLGDFEWASYLSYDQVIIQFGCGNNLLKIDQEAFKLGGIVEKMNQKIQYFHLVIYHQAIQNLIDKNENPCHLKGEVYDEDKMLPVHLKEKDSGLLSHMYNCKMVLICFFGEYDAYLPIAKEVEKYIITLPGTHTLASFYFYDSLIYLGLYDSLPENEKRKALKRVDRNQKKIKKWMKHCPENQEHKFYLVEAERMRISARYQEAVELYHRSITAAQKNAYLHDEGLANECAAKMFLKNNQETYAQIHLQAAYTCYSRWGAIAKVKQLENKYGYLQRQTASRSDMHHDSGILSGDSSSSNMSFSSYGTQTIDLSTLMKAAQTISGEINLGNLLEKMMKILLENAGAQRGFLLLEKESDKNLYIEAEGAVNKEIRVLNSIPLENNSQLSTAIVYYVKKTRKTLVLRDAINEGSFTNDSYVKKMQSKSIFCEPIMNKGNMTGLIYLENNLTTNAFSPDNFMLLRILSSQAAISIENARLFETMKEKERLKQEMKIAEHIQTSLCPAKVEHPELDIAAIMIPAEQVGGDYYDFLYDSQKNLWFAIGDVSGHGVTPGLIMMMAQTINTTIVTHFDLQLDKVMQIINTILYENVTNRLKENHFMTFTLFKYLGKGEFLHSGAHLDLLIYRQSTQRVEFIETKGTFLNVLPDISKITETNQFQLEVGDKLILYSDGLTEAMNKEGELFDTEGITSIVEENGGKNVEELKSMIIDGANKWSENCQKDDITLVLIERKK